MYVRAEASRLRLLPALSKCKLIESDLKFAFPLTSVRGLKLARANTLPSPWYFARPDLLPEARPEFCCRCRALMALCAQAVDLSVGRFLRYQYVALGAGPPVLTQPVRRHCPVRTARC
jgi:hypothetical protein